MSPLTIFRAGALGDFVVTVPALRELHREHGQLRYVGNAAAARELAGELFESVESIDESRWAGLFDDGSPLPRPEGQAVVLLRDRSAAARLRHAGWAVIVDAPPFPTQPGDHVAAHLLAAVGKPAAIARRRRTANLRRSRQPGPHPYLVVHPGSGSPRKNWPADRFARAVEDFPLPVVVLAGPADDEAAACLLRLHPTTLTRPTSLTELRGVLAGAGLYVGNDSGVSHIAAALGVPTVALFGPTRAVRWAPWGPQVLTVEPARRCPLCLNAEERPAACRCIETVAVDDVRRALEQLLVRSAA